MTPTIEITLRTPRRALQVEAMIDTGFAGGLSMPMLVASRLRSEVAGWGELKTAGGTIIRTPLVRCEVDLAGTTTRVEAFVVDNDVILVGTDLLRNCELTVDCDTGAVQLTRKRS